MGQRRNVSRETSRDECEHGTQRGIACTFCDDEDNAIQRLPTWTECEAARDDRTATALQEFIYEYEPSDADEWRTRLAALLQESYAAATPQKGKVK